MTISVIESLANAIIGLIVSWVATWLILGFPPAQAVAITAMFFGLSFSPGRRLSDIRPAPARAIRIRCDSWQ